MKKISEIFNVLVGRRANNIIPKITELTKTDSLIDSLFSSPEIIYAIDSSHRITWTNSAASEYLPNSLGRKCHEVLFDNSVNCQNCKCHAALDTGLPQSNLILANFHNRSAPMRYWNEIVLPLTNNDESPFSALIIISPVNSIEDFKRDSLENKVKDKSEDDLSNFFAENYSPIFNHLNIPICITGNNLRVKLANEAFAKILDTNIDAIQNELITEIMPEINTIGTQKILTVVVSGNNEQTYFLNLDQLAVPKKVKLIISPVKYSDAIINGLIWRIEILQNQQSTIPDISEKSLFGRNYGLLTIDLEDRVIGWNDIMTNIFGWSENEMLGVVNPIISSSLLTQFKKSESHSKIDLSVKNKKNEMLDVSITVFPVTDSTATLSGYICMVEDISNEKFIKSEFKELEERYNNFLKRFEGITFKFDKDFNPVYFNGSIQKLTGYSEEEFISGSVTFKDIVYGDDKILLDDLIKKIGKRVRSARELEIRIASKTGEVKWLYFSFQSSFDDRGDISEIQGFMYNITQRKETEEELKRSREQFRTLALYVEKAREDEKKHLALEIHDELGHALTAIKLELAWVMKKKYLRQELMFEKVRKMNEIIESTIRKVRSISSQLRPSVLDHFGLEAALEWQVGEFQKRSAVRCKLQLDRKEVHINEQASTAIFRIFQEILTNIAKHAKATRVDVIFEKTDEDVILKVRDNGKGFNTENIKHTKSLGILGMTERANAINGKLTVNSVVGIGTTVTLVVPVHNIEGKS
jgi:PAS domain S-box-containing protein